ncbi:MAG TPA: hypothetical protein VHA10_13735 [Hypericibacter adhaerens]|jgi:uncharacterized membrane protein|uniref:COG4648 family protein n=1 Tax=Hypericibacter adhaerens TaxID=2602016 RepID=UPI002C341472|nr:hypothetical protein [Hypericibacter adhaerens]HWA44268.1 hypothetical protein [Hypericibacter adhaerens]
MQRRALNPWLLAAAIGGVLYPFAVYAGLTRSGLTFLRPWGLVAIGLILIGLRLFAMRRVAGHALPTGFAVAALVLVALLALDGEIAAKAYPVVISLAVAAIFGCSLIWPPTVVERMARIREPVLPPQAVAYTRGVTWLWFGFLLANAFVAAILGVWGTLSQWTLWTGLVSYLLMGALFLGELTWRHHLRSRA